MKADDEPLPARSAPSHRKGRDINMSKGRGKNDQAAEVQQLILGTKKHYPNANAQLQIGGVALTVTALTQVMQSFVDQRQAVEASKAATRTKVETERTQAPSQIAVVAAFKTVVRGTFGLAPPKARTPLTAEQAAVAVAKRVATRAARLTVGKNQKKGIKGAVKATLVVTPLGGSAPVATPPAPTGTAPTGGTTPHTP
jgi:hypothetical protein